MRIENGQQQYRYSDRMRRNGQLGEDQQFEGDSPDLFGLYLKDIRGIELITATDEIRLGRTIEEANYISFRQTQIQEQTGIKPNAAQTLLSVIDQVRSAEPFIRTLAGEIGIDNNLHYT